MPAVAADVLRPDLQTPLCLQQAELVGTHGLMLLTLPELSCTALLLQQNWLVGVWQTSQLYSEARVAEIGWHAIAPMLVPLCLRVETFHACACFAAQLLAVLLPGAHLPSAQRPAGG
jgi:hypothetical protein